jgi:hypothetical protein
MVAFRVGTVRPVEGERPRAGATASRSAAASVTRIAASILFSLVALSCESPAERYVEEVSGLCTKVWSAARAPDPYLLEAITAVTAFAVYPAPEAFRDSHKIVSDTMRAVVVQDATRVDLENTARVCDTYAHFLEAGLPRDKP